VADGQKIKIHCARIYRLRRGHVVFRRASRIAYIYRRAEFFYGGLTGPVVMGFKHINGGNQWKALLAGHSPTGSELGL
jgi:hypothetical protein